MNKLIYPGISILNVDISVCQDFLDFIDNKNFNFKSEINGCSTINGYQTENILELINTKDSIKSGLDQIKDVIENHISAKFEYHWIHLINYQKNGFQKKHNHSHNEECSFILYLNDSSDGETNFYVNPERNIQYKITPETGKMVVFSSSILHDSEKTDGDKKVLVGGLKIVN
jgi:hypothetical protein